MPDNVSLTYEKLFDLARKERTLPELQKLDKSYYADVVAYLNDKSKSFSGNKKGSLFSKSEQSISQKQLDNIQKLIKDLYIRREKKIINLAMMKSRTGSNLLDTSGLLLQEKELFHQIVSILDGHKDKTLFKLLSGSLPDGSIATPSSVMAKSNTAQAVKDVQRQRVDALKSSVDSVQSSSPALELSLVKVIFQNNVPKFVGKELEVYGPYSKSQTADLPSNVATVLINKGHAKKG